MNVVLKVLLMLLLVSNSYGIFDHIDWGASAVGEGIGYVGSGKVDSSIVMWNPAGLVYLGSMNELNGMYGIPFSGIGLDLKYYMLSFAKRLDNNQGIGLGVGMFNVLDVWKEESYVLSYGRLFGKGLSLGLSIKYMVYRINLNADEYGGDPLLSNGGKDVVSSDIGLVYSISENLRCGFVVKDFINPDVGVNSEDRLQMGYLLGLNYMSMLGNMGVIYSLGYYLRGEENGYSIGGNLFLSGGKIVVRGSYSDTRYAFGAGYNLDKISIEYTYAIPVEITETSGSHYVSVIFRF